MIPEIPFVEFPKISRFNRDAIITEKLDGTNAQVYINDAGDRAFAGSRSRWIKIGDDNFDFAQWVHDNHNELLKLGPGSHFGEWWGKGVQRGYGLSEKRFSLFNTKRWATDRPSCCGVVPTLWEGLMGDIDPWSVLRSLKEDGSVAAPGFKNPEGIVIFHVPSNGLFKMTLDKNDQAKGNV